MTYIALLRGINVGGNRKVPMKQLRALFETMGCSKVTTYLNSGNVIFESNVSQNTLQNNIPKELNKEFGFDIQTLIKSRKEIKKIAESIPKTWKNDSEQKTDIAYLFPEIDSISILDELPVKEEFLDIKYVKGAIIWNVKRVNYNKSHLNKIIGLPQYKLMTVRNVNTARFLAEKNI